MWKPAGQSGPASRATVPPRGRALTGPLRHRSQVTSDRTNSPSEVLIDTCAVPDVMAPRLPCSAHPYDRADETAQLPAALVAAVTNPGYQPGRDRHEQYREHVTASLQASPWARVVKASDFTDNAVGLIDTTGPMPTQLARKYAPLVPALRDLVLRLDTPLDAGVKDMIARQLQTA